MSTYTTDSSTIRLHDILSLSFTEADFKIKDYVYDAVPDPVEDYTTIFGGHTQKSVIDRHNSAFICELTLRVNIESFFNSVVDGYYVKIGLEDRADDYYEQLCYFSDDFEGIIDLGEQDTNALKEHLSAASTFMSAQAASSDSSLTTVSTRHQAGYVSLNGGTSFSALAKDMVTRGQDPSESLNLSMPTFALPSAKTSFGSVGHSSSPYSSELLEKQSRLMLSSGRFPDGKISITDQREAARPEASASEASYSLQSSILAPDAEPSEEQAAIVLGNIYKYTTDFFVSKRLFEIPRQYIDEGSSSSSRISIHFMPYIKEENRTSETDGRSHTWEPVYGERYSKEISHERDSLFTPTNSPSLRVIHTSPGKISYEVNRGDPAINYATITKRYFDPKSGESVSYGSPTEIRFEGSEDMFTVVNEPCKNVLPNYPMLIASTYINGAVSNTTTMISKGFLNKLYSGENLQDTTVITCFNSLNGVLVEVRYIPEDVYYVELHREDLSLSTSDIGRNKMLIRRNVRAMSGFDYPDNNTAGNRRYRYFVKCTRSPGPTSRNLLNTGNSTSFGTVGALYEDYIAADDEVIDRISPATSVLFNVSIEHASSVYGPDSTRHTFRPNVTLNDTDFTYFIEQLSSVGLVDYYFDELQDRKNELSTIVAFIVERIDRRTGERETLSRLARPNVAYEDRSPRLSARDSITYIFKMCLVKPESFFIATDPSASEAERTSALAAVSSAFTASTGIIPSDDLTVGSTESTVLSSAETGRHFPVTMPARVSEAVVNNVNSAPMPTGLLMTWKVHFTLEAQTQAFIINTTLNGVSLAPRLVAVVLDDETNMYMHLDDEYFFEVGTKVYTISCVFNDFTIGPPSTTISYTREATVPSETFTHMDVEAADPSVTGGLRDDFGSSWL